jgi:hypothetical protein
MEAEVPLNKAGMAIAPFVRATTAHYWTKVQCTGSHLFAKRNPQEAAKGVMDRIPNET